MDLCCYQTANAAFITLSVRMDRVKGKIAFRSRITARPWDPASLVNGCYGDLTATVSHPAARPHARRFQLKTLTLTRLTITA